jgi:hypothetical protein
VGYFFIVVVFALVCIYNLDHLVWSSRPFGLGVSAFRKIRGLPRVDFSNHKFSVFLSPIDECDLEGSLPFRSKDEHDGEDYVWKCVCVC